MKVDKPKTSTKANAQTKAELLKAVAELRAENEKLRAGGGRVKVNPLDKECGDPEELTIVPDRTAQGELKFTKSQYGNDHVNFATVVGGESVTPDPVFRGVIKAHYGAKFRDGKKTADGIAKWFLRDNAWDAMMSDFESGAWDRHCAAECERIIENEGDPVSEAGEAIVAYYSK